MTDQHEGLIFNLQKFALHDGAGIRTDVFFQGCNLRCKWCSNPESQAMRPPDGSAKRYGLEPLVAELLKDKPFYDSSGGGVTLTGGEALLQPIFVGKLCRALKASGVNVALETAASIAAPDFEQTLGLFDTIHIDLKHYDSHVHKLGTGVGNELILANIRAALASKVATIIRIPVIPGFNDSSADMHGFAALLGQLGAREVQLLPFHQLGESKYQKLGLDYEYADIPQLHDEDIESFAELLRESGANVQIGG